MTVVNVHVDNFGAICFGIVFKDQFEMQLYVIPILVDSFTGKRVDYNGIKL